MSRRKPIPHMPWSAKGLWHPRLSSLLVLSVGFVFAGLGESMIYRSVLGNSPWTVLAEGITRHTGIDVAAVNLLISVFILLIWRLWQIRIGLGTLLNALVCAYIFYLGNQFIPSMANEPVFWRILMSVGGTVSIAIGSALYISCYMGTGPRDGLMVAISSRLNKPLAAVRTSLELFACISGYLLGGTLGLGTLIFALSVGPILGMLVGLMKKHYMIYLKNQRRHAHRTL